MLLMDWKDFDSFLFKTLSFLFWIIELDSHSFLYSFLNSYTLLSTEQ